MRRYELPILLLLSLFFIVLGATDAASIADEGFAVYNATRVQDGFLPYRDFFALYAPGQFYTMSWVFGIFGSSLSVSRGYDILLRLGLIFIVYLLGQKLISRQWAIVPSVFVMLLLGTCGFFSYAMIPGVILSLLSVLCLLNFITSRRKGWLIASGVATGVAEIFRQDVGLYTAACFSFVLLLFTFSLAPKGYWRRIVLYETIYLAPVFIIVAPLWIFFAVAGSAWEMWLDLWVFPATILHGIRSLPYPDFFLNPIPLSHFRAVVGTWIRFYFPLIVCFFTLAQIALTWPTAPQSDRNSLRVYGSLLITLLSIMLFAQAWSRNDPIHLMPTTITSFILAVKLLADFNFWKHPLPVKAGAAVVLAIVTIVYAVTPLKRWNTVRSIYSLAGCPSPNGRAGCVFIKPEQIQAMNFVQTLVPRSERIYVGNTRHDQVFTGDLMFYFLADRHCAAKYQEMIPRLTNTLPVQQGMVEDLKREKVRCIVLYSGFDGTHEPNTSMENTGVTYLDDFIHSNFRLTRQFGDYTIFTNTPQVNAQ